MNDLVWLRLSVGGVRLDLHATVQADAALASGELRLRTLPLRLPEASLAALRGVEGVALPDTPFEAIPLLSTPCDLHALAVLAVRTLLVGAEAPLPVAVDETLSLAAQVAADHNPDVALPRRVRAIVEGDERWLASLGPHRLVDPPMEAGAARAALPMELWCEALAAIVRMFPGVGPDSVCRDAGDAPAGGLHRVFDPAMADLRGLLRRARSLIVGDAASNREIRSVLRAYAESRAEPGRAPAAAAR